MDRNESGCEIYVIVGPFRAVPADDNGPNNGHESMVAWATRSID